MTDDSENIPGYLDFHPCDAPKGMLFYNLRDLTDKQKLMLKEYKLNIMRENQTYLKNHPEIKVVVQYLLKAILKARPKIKLTQFLSQILIKEWKHIEECVKNAELDAYESHKPSNRHSSEQSHNTQLNFDGILHQMDNEYDSKKNINGGESLKSNEKSNTDIIELLYTNSSL